MHTKITSRDKLNFVSLAEAKRQLVITEDEDDTHIQTIIDASMGLAERYTKRILSAAVVTLMVSGVTELYLPYGDAKAITSVQVDGEDIDFSFSDISNKVKLTGLSSIDDEVIIIYETGYGDGEVPEEIKMGALMTISSLYENREDSVVGATVENIPLNSTLLFDAYRLESI